MTAANVIATNVITAFGVSAFCTLILPIVILIVLAAKHKLSGLPLLAGFLSFFISQIILRLPLLQILSGQAWYAQFASNPLVAAIVIGGFSAALFEETARLVGASLLKKHRSYQDVLSFGLGHAFCEVIFLVGFSQLNNIIICLMVNSQQTDAMGNALSLVTQQMASVSPMLVYVGIVERVSAVAYHLFATCLVFRAVTFKKPQYYFAALLAHTVFNAASALLMNYFGIWVSEGVLLVAAIPMAVFVWRQKYVFLSHKTFAQTSMN